MRKLPSPQSLKSFEAAARHLSFKRAAEELFVTPTAISHQVKSLEAALDCRLFERRTRQVELTRQGQDLFGVLRKAFDRIDAAIGRIGANREREVVTLGLGPIIGTRWLAPRIGEFWKGHADIDLRLHHSPLPLRHSAEYFDLAIAWGDGRWPSMRADPFISIAVSPVLAARLPRPKRVADLLRYPLIHQRDREGWKQWLAAAGTELRDDTPGTIIDDANLALQTALDGHGVALGILPFVEAELKLGRLQQPFDLAIDPGQAYYLIYRESSLANPAVAAVRDWLLAQI